MAIDDTNFVEGPFTDNRAAKRERAKFLRTRVGNFTKVAAGVKKVRNRRLRKEKNV